MAGLTSLLQKHRKVALVAGLALALLFVLRSRSQNAAASTADTGVPIATDGTLAAGGTDTSTGASAADELAAAQSDQLAAIQQAFGDFAAAEASQLQDLGASVSQLEDSIGANQALIESNTSASLLSQVQAGDKGVLSPLAFSGPTGAATAAPRTTTTVPSRVPQPTTFAPKPPRPKSIRPRVAPRPVAKPKRKPKRKTKLVPSRTFSLAGALVGKTPTRAPTGFGPNPATLLKG